jgi:hypothetical protein
MDNFWKVVSDARSLLILTGLVLFALGLVGEITNYIPHMGFVARVIASTVGAAIALVGIWLVIVDMRGPVRGVRITFPSDREGVPEKITVRGEVSKAIPDGKELWLLRIYEKHDRFVPMGPAHIRSD